MQDRDHAVPDTTVPDTTVPDNAVPDHAVPDNAVPDNAVMGNAVMGNAVMGNAVMEFLLSRRSTPARALIAPVPDRAQLLPLLRAAARVPDHGKLAPWRFVVLEKPALRRLAGMVPGRGRDLNIAPDKIDKLQSAFADAGLVVTVVSVTEASQKVPRIEQSYSAGAVCLSLLNAALASGWGANWLTGWVAYDAVFLKQGLGLADGESVAGFIHLGTPRARTPERPRPDLAAITTWLSA